MVKMTSLKFKLSIGKRKKGNLSFFEFIMVVCARQHGLSISDLPEFPTKPSQRFTEDGLKDKISSKQQFSASKMSC